MNLTILQHRMRMARRGDSMIELLAAITIIAIMALGTSAGVSRSLGAHITAARALQALNLSQNFIDQFKANVCRLQDNAFTMNDDANEFLSAEGWRNVNDPAPYAATGLFMDMNGNLLANGGPQSMRRFDPDPNDSDPTLYRIRWQVVDEVTDTVIDRLGKSAGGAALFKMIMIEIAWPVNPLDDTLEPPNHYTGSLVLGDRSCA